MAATNMKAVKLRIKSVQNTMQITKAMQLVASSKLRRARDRAAQSKPYLEIMRLTLQQIAKGNTEHISPYAQNNGSDRWLFIVIAGDRGLAGGYNANVLKAADRNMKDKDCIVLPVGKKALEYYRSHGAEILTEYYAEVGRMSISDGFSMASRVCKGYKEGKFGHVVMVYTNFVSMLSQEPQLTSMLPVSDFAAENFSFAEEDFGETKPSAGQVMQKVEEENAEPEKAYSLILYEPDSETVFDDIVPEYLAGLIYTAVNVSVASELAARRTAMEAATDNAEEMIEKLSLYYNRARQASITQEITEIVAGAEGGQ